jgi:hypothetical protein
MPEWWIRAACEFMLCLVVIVQSLAKKKTEFEPSEPSSTSRDIHVRKNTKIWHYEEGRAPGRDPGAPGSGPGLPGKRGRELLDRVRESSRTLSGPSR